MQAADRGAPVGGDHVPSRPQQVVLPAGAVSGELALVMGHMMRAGSDRSNAYDLKGPGPSHSPWPPPWWSQQSGMCR